MKTNLKFNNFLKQNSPTILTVVGAIGVGLTAVMSARDTVKAMKRIKDAELEKCAYSSYGDEQVYIYNQLTKKDKIKIAVPCYIPTVLTGLSTILCICGANKLNKNVQKSITSAYIMLDQSYKEYRKSVENVFGEEGHKHVVEDIVERKAEETELKKDTDTDIFFDFFSLQFFESTMETVREAEKTANEIMKNQGYVSLQTVYSILGLDILDTDTLLGWSTNAGIVYGYDSVNFDISEVKNKDGSVHYVLDFMATATDDYLYL